MKKTGIRTICLLLTLLLALPTLAGLTAFAGNGAAIVASGYCGMPKNWDHSDEPYSIEDLGHNLRWTLDSEGTLTVSGTGDMADFLVFTDYHEMETFDVCPTPWNDNDIKNVIIEEGVETIGQGAFVSANNKTDVSVAGSVKKIKTLALGKCPSITLPDSTSVQPDAMSARNVTICRGDYDRAGAWNLYAGEDWEDYQGDIRTFRFADGAKYIPGGAFYHETKIKSLIIPSSVTAFSWLSFFNGCTALTDIYFAVDEARWKTIKEDHDSFKRSEEFENYYGEEEYQLYNWDNVKIHRVEYIDGHYIEYVDATEATATEHGYTAGVYCVDTDTWFSGHEVVHNTLGERTVVKEPTEDEPGECVIVCTVCGESGLYAMEPYSPHGPQPDDPDDPDDPGNPGEQSHLPRFLKSIVDWFLRLIRWLGNLIKH